MLETYIQNFSDNDIAAFARTMLSFHPDPIQARVLDPNIRRGILNCCRQWGKSTILAIKAVHHAYTHPESLTRCVSPTSPTKPASSAFPAAKIRPAVSPPPCKRQTRPGMPTMRASLGRRGRRRG